MVDDAGPFRPTVGVERIRRPVNDVVALVLGTVVVLSGLAGFAVSGGYDGAGTTGGLLLGLFQVNVLHNVVHLVLGVALVTSVLRVDDSVRGTNRTVGTACLVLSAAGFLVVGTAANILALNRADNVAHLVLGMVLVGVGIGADRPGTA